MSWWSRMANVVRGDRLSREIDEEVRSHLEEAAAEGREVSEARRAFGSPLRLGEESREIRLIPWLECLRADAVFGWRQLVKKKVTSAAAILSLALAIGACTGAFRLIDALLLRPLPVAHAERLYDISREAFYNGKKQSFDGWAYPSFRLMRAAVKGQAELIAVSYAERRDLTYKSDAEMERAYVQYVSGWMFGSFGLRPTLGRLLNESDDLKPRAHAFAVLSYDYWMRRFGGEPKVLGRTFRMGEDVYQIVGVGPKTFTGTETGTVTDVFVPTMMNSSAVHDDEVWHRSLALVKPGAAMEPLRAKLAATSMAFERERAKGFTGMSQESIDQFLNQQLVLIPAAAGVSELQDNYRGGLVALGVLVALVLLIACANVANLMAAQAASRAREMALRVSIGAGRWRLVQLVLAESAILAAISGGLGAVFAWWSAPFVVRMINPPDNPARLNLPGDWRVLGFGVALTVVVMMLFALTPALRASAVKPASALKGGDDAHTKRRLMHGLIAAQVAFCFLVLFVAGLFAATFEHLSNRPLGFAARGLLTVDTVAAHGVAPVYWDQVAEHLRGVPGVESVALAKWPLLEGGGWNGFVSVEGAPPGPVLAYFLSVSPGWLQTMKLPLMDGRDLRPDDTFPGAAIVNEAFVREFFNGRNPIGKWFSKGGNQRLQVVGVARDAPYRSIHEPILPSAYVAMHGSTSQPGVFEPFGGATFMVRTLAENPMALAATLRREVPRGRPEFRVSNIRTQMELVRAQTVRERLLAMLGIFFAAVALLLAAVGLYGVLDYSVVQRRKEIGIRMAIGAPARNIARLVTVEIFAMVFAGAVAGMALGAASARYVEALLYEVKAGDPAMLAFPLLIILSSALVAALPAVFHAVRIDPVEMLRAE